MAARSGFSKFFWAVLMAIMISSIPHVVMAETAERMISTTEVVSTLSRVDAEARVRSYLDRKDLQEGLVKMGLSPTEISKRVASLSPAELNKLADQMDQARYGGDVVGILVIVLLIVLIVFLVKRI
jgi:hypothetical protein